MIEASDPTAPTEVATYATSGSALDVHVINDYIYVAYDNAGRAGGLLILRFTGAEPTPPSTTPPVNTATPNPTATASPTPTKLIGENVYLPLVVRRASRE